MGSRARGTGMSWVLLGSGFCPLVWCGEGRQGDGARLFLKLLTVTTMPLKDKIMTDLISSPEFISIAKIRL